MGEKKSILQGIAYGLVPHIGCIAFLIGSILGVTVLTQLFKPLLMTPYFFHILILVSFVFATISSALYLKKNGILSPTGIKRKWKYLSIMYGSTIGVNLLLFVLIFPLLANFSLSPTLPLTGASLANNNMKLSVDIPCSGHAPLISNELKSINGITGVQFSFPNIFYVSYDSTKTSKQEIISLDVFKTYKASVLEELNAQNKVDNQQLPSSTNSGGCGCGVG